MESQDTTHPGLTPEQDAALSVWLPESQAIFRDLAARIQKLETAQAPADTPATDEAKAYSSGPPGAELVFRCMQEKINTLTVERSDIENTLNAANVEVFASPNEDGDELPFTLPERVEQLRNMLQSAQHDVRTLQGEVKDAREQGRQEAREGIAAEINAKLNDAYCKIRDDDNMHLIVRGEHAAKAVAAQTAADIARNWKPEVQS
jgi:hypothetical protein